MDIKNRDTITSTIRQSINKKLDFHVNPLEYAIVKLYINYQNSKVWENTNLEGYLVLVNDSYFQSLKLQIFDFINFNKEFEIELYANIEDGYAIQKDAFHSLEFPSFFLGLNFSDKSQAEKFRNKIFMYSKLKNLDKYFACYINDQDKENSMQDINVNNNNNSKILATSASNLGNKATVNSNNNVTINSNNNTNYLKNNSEEFNLKFAKTINEINASEIKFKKVERILELEIEKKIFNNSKNPVIYPEMKTGESKFLYEKYIKSKNLYFENIQSFFKELKKKYEGISLQDASGDSGSVMQIGDEENSLGEISDADHKNENEEFIAYNLEKRNTIKIRSLSYLKRVEEENAKLNKNNENAFNVNDNKNNSDKNLNNDKVPYENPNFESDINRKQSDFNKANYGKKNSVKVDSKNASPAKTLGKKPSSANDDIINRYSNNKNLNQAINMKRAMAYQDIEENTSESKLSDFE